MSVSPVEKGIAQFLRSLKEKNASTHTIKAYSSDLEQFSAYIGPAKWDDLDHVRIRGVLLGGAASNHQTRLEGRGRHFPAPDRTGEGELT